LPILFIGIGQLLIITGLLAMAILMFWQVGIITKGQIEFEKKQAEWKHSKGYMDDLKKDAEKRLSNEKETNS
jgi:ABC-type multidrug transport system ATPase subunit